MLVEIIEVNFLRSDLNVHTDCCVIKKLKLLLHVVFMFCLFLTKILIISINSIKRLGSVIEADCVPSEVGSKYLSQIGRMSCSK
jgi:hypothetical protein